MITRLGLSGISRSPYGSFAGKAAIISGVKTSLIESATLSATGSVAVTGSKTTTLETATLDGSGSVFISGTKTTTLDDVSLSATGGVIGPITGDKSTTLEITLTATGSVQVIGVYTNTFDVATLDATGLVTDGGPVITTIEKRLQVNGPEYRMAISDPDKALTIH